mgnify:FL=1
MARKTPVIPTAFTVPSYSALVATYSTYLDNELTAAGFSWSSSVQYSLPWVVARVLALVMGGVYRFQRWLASTILPSTARDLDTLRMYGEERGVFWRSGTRVTGTATIQNTAATDITLPASLAITDIAVGASQGLRHVVSVPWTITAGSTDATVPVRGEFIGAEYIVPAPGHPARIDNPPSGINATAILNQSTGGGLEDETAEELRTRVLEAIQDPPEGGAVADWKTWTRSILTQNVDGVWIYGPGDVVPASVDVSGYVPTGSIAILYSLDGTGTDKIPTGGNVSDMTAYLLAHDDRPVTANPIAFAPVDNNVSISLKVRAASGATVGAEVTALEAAIRSALALMLQERLADLATPGATSAIVIQNSWIHDAIAKVAGLSWWEITTLDGGSGAAGITTTHSWELTRFTTTFSWV